MKIIESYFHEKGRVGKGEMGFELKEHDQFFPQLLKDYIAVRGICLNSFKPNDCDNGTVLLTRRNLSRRIDQSYACNVSDSVVVITNEHRKIIVVNRSLPEKIFKEFYKDFVGQR